MATAKQPKNLLQKQNNQHSFLFFHRKSMSINTKHAVNDCIEHHRDESVFMEHTDASPQITERRRRVQTLTSCVSAQASWPENCPWAKTKRVKQRRFKNCSKDRKVRNHQAYKLQRSEFSPSRSTTHISFHSQFEQINNMNKEICKTFLMFHAWKAESNYPHKLGLGNILNVKLVSFSVHKLKLQSNWHHRMLNCNLKLWKKFCGEN